MRILRLAGLDLLAVFAAYLVSVVFRIGGRFELAEPEQAIALAILAGVVQVAGNAGLGVYRPMWRLTRSRDLVDLAAPALTGALVVLVINIATGEHGIPLAALPIAAGLAFLLMVARRLRRRWRTILRAILGQRDIAMFPPLVALGAAPDPTQVVIPVTAPNSEEGSAATGSMYASTPYRDRANPARCSRSPRYTSRSTVG